MNRGGKASPGAGFTIVETLIVMAVTSALLVSAMVVMSGRQAKTDFQVGREAVTRDFQSIISRIESGRYDSTNSFSCDREDIAWYGAYPRFNETTPAPQGTNGQCIFLGQALVVGENATDYKLYLMAGSREGYGGGSDVATLNDANPKALESTVIVEKFPNSFRYAGSRYVNMDGTLGAVNAATQPVLTRLMLDLDGDDMLAGKLAGSQSVTIHKSAPWNLTVTFTIGGSTESDPVKALQLCLASGGTNQSIILTIGGNFSNKVSSTVVAGRTCGW